MAIATSFDDFVVVRFWQTWWFITLLALAVLVAVGTTVRVVEQRKFQLQLQHAEQERALERERARIAQDLHDDLGSSLTRLSLLSGLLKADKDNPDRWRRTPPNWPNPPTRRCARWRKSSGRCGPAATRCKAWWITSRILPTNCLKATPRAAGSICRTICRRMPLPPDVRHNIFLIVKEALTNALKHAGAQARSSVQAKVSGNTLEILVQDDGKGFDPASPAESRRNGLGNMRRRAEAIGGSLELQSTPGTGTTLRLVVRLKNGMTAGKT